MARMMLLTLWPNTDQRDCEDEHRKCLQDVGRAHDQRADRAAPSPLTFVVADDRAGDAADRRGHQGAEYGDGEIDTRREHHAAENIHARAIGAEQVASARWQ